ncbi:MAG TPA: GNAT family N-acetyltransferase [Terracidiphilus sp.]|jgi:GNAT superfamily N-acetyltransferase|nr:GNAT family N-acetyltransferase [Terracidiphilus sp.]
MEFSIRKAAIEDAGHITRVHVNSWKTTYQGIVPDEYLASLKIEDRVPRWTEQLADAEHLIFVAENQQGVCGFIGGGPMREPIGEYDGELYAIYLLRACQLCGVGRSLVHTLAENLLARDFKSMAVWVLEANPAVLFYQALGATLITQKIIEIAGVRLPELALGWPDLKASLGTRFIAAKDGVAE